MIYLAFSKLLGSYYPISTYKNAIYLKLDTVKKG